MPSPHRRKPAAAPPATRSAAPGSKEDLRAEIRHLRDLLDRSPYGILIHGERVLYCNEAAVFLFGVNSQAELIGARAADLLFEPDQAREVERQMAALLAHEDGVGRSEDMELLARQRNGRRIWISVRVQRTVWNGQRALYCTCMDISKRKHSEEQREADRRLLAAVMDAVPHGIAVRDREGRFLMVNKAQAEYLGIDPQDAPGRHALEVGPQDAGRLEFTRQTDPEVLEQGGMVERPVHLINMPDGSARYRHLLKVPLRNEDGAIAGLVSVALDVTSQHQAQEQVRAQQRLLQAVLDAIPTWLFVKDRNSRFVMVNDTMAREVGLPPDHFKGLAHGDAPQGTRRERAKLLRDERKLITEGRALDLEEELTLPDGRRTRRHVRKVPLRDEDGSIIGLVGISEDVTERRVLEDQVRRMQRIESIGTLAGGIAHDFNNLLFPIIGFTEMTMRELPPTGRAHDNLAVVRDAALRARDIVAQILTFSRRSEGRPAVIPLRPLLQESLRFLRSTLPVAVRIEDALAAEPLHVNADGVQIHQVVMNLCLNAAQAMPTGGTLSVSLAAVDVIGLRGYAGGSISGECVRITVEDTGIGMDAHTMTRIFEPFYTTKATGQGTGLGLATVLGIVTQHQGVVDVHSNLGTGTRVDVYLPRSLKAADVVEPAQVAPDSQPATILFVDDEVGIVELVRMVLGDAGYEVSAFSNSRTALEAFQQHPQDFDLLITDQSMPEMTGDKVVEAVRRLRPELPVILGTGYAEALTQERQRELGIDHVYLKPITPGRLCEIVAQALSQRAG